MQSNDLDAKAFYDVGRGLLQDGDLVGAIAHLQLSAGLLPHFKTLELLGEAWLKSGEPMKAIVPLAAATTLNEQGRAPAWLAEALLATGEPIRAHRIARLALARGPTNRRAKAVFDATLAKYEACGGK